MVRADVAVAVKAEWFGCIPPFFVMTSKLGVSGFSLQQGSWYLDTDLDILSRLGTRSPDSSIGSSLDL